MSGKSLQRGITTIGIDIGKNLPPDRLDKRGATLLSIQGPEEQREAAEASVEP